MVQCVAVGHFHLREPFEVVANGILIGHTDTAVQLHAGLADEAHALTELHFSAGDRLTSFRGRGVEL